MTQARNAIYRRIRRAAAAAYIFATLACCTATGQNPLLNDEARRQAGLVWEKILTKCGDSYYYSGSNLGESVLGQTIRENEKGWDEVHGVGKHLSSLDLLTEYQGVSGVSPPILIIGGAKIAGGRMVQDMRDKDWPLDLPWQEAGLGQLAQRPVEWWGVAVMRATKARQFDPRSQKWSVLPTFTDAQWATLALLPPLDPFGSTTEIYVQMEKVAHGKWYFGAMFPGKHFELEQITTGIFPDCENGKVVLYEPALNGCWGCVGADATNSASNGKAVQPSPPHLVRGASGNDVNKELRTYKGTVDGFATELPGFIQRAKLPNGLTAQDYKSEIQEILTTARACEHITPMMIAAATNEYGTIETPEFQEDYRPCLWGGENVSVNAHHLDPTRRPSLLMTIKPRGKWGDGKGLTITVSFEPAKGDAGVNKKTTSDDLKIVDALIGTNLAKGDFPANGSVPEAPRQDNGGRPLNSRAGGSIANANPPNSRGTDSSSRTLIPPPTPSKSDERTLQLTRTHPYESRTATITAPGRGLQNHNIFHIDTRDFAEGGTLVIDINISPNSATDGSFDLFQDGVPIPVQGGPAGTLTGAYDRPRGSSTRIEYRFERGQVFALNLQGNWFSPKGATGPVQFRATVRE